MIIEFKYDINDSVWFIRNAKVYCGIITECSYFKHLTCGEEYEVKCYGVISGYGKNTRLNEDESIIVSRYNGEFVGDGSIEHMMGGTTCSTTHHWMEIPKIKEEKK